MLCGFALMIPFELILEVFLGIDTQLKPFRVFVLLAIGGFGVKILSKGFKNLEFWNDLPLYLIFLYGVLISYFRMFTPAFSQSIFRSEVILLSLNLTIFFIFQNTSLDIKKWNQIFWFLTLGVIGNSFYIFSQFYFFGLYGRDGGLMDNPNYVALSIVIAIAFLLYQISITKKWLPKSINIGLFLFLLFVFPATGSRTGLAILAVLLVLGFIFLNFRTQIIAIVAIGFASFFLVNQDFRNFNIGSSFVLTNRVANKVGEQDVRVPIWKGAMKIGADNYYMGLGIGQFKANFPTIFRNEYHPTILKVVERGAFLSTHSDYISLLVVYGIIGLLLYLYYLIRIKLKIFKKIRYSTSFEETRFYQLNFIILACVIIFGIAAENFLSPLYWIIMGLCSASLSMKINPNA